jgi:ATP-dependent helicase/nuclease subunit A
VERELRFARFVPLASLTENPALAEAAGDRTVYVQGSIDLLAEFPDGHLELCDYKTDRLTPEEVQDPALYRARVADTHRHQLAEYAAAVEELYGKRPTKAYVFSLTLGEAIEVGMEE